MRGKIDGLNFRDLAIVTICLPFVSLIGSLVYALLFYFDEVTESKCGVHNFVPSISGAMCMKPLLHLWRLCIILHAGPRMLASHLYYRWHLSLWMPAMPWSIYKCISSSVYFFNMADILSLCGLTIVSTVDNFCKTSSIFWLYF